MLTSTSAKAPSPLRNNSRSVTVPVLPAIVRCTTSSPQLRRGRRDGQPWDCDRALPTRCRDAEARSESQVHSFRARRRIVERRHRGPVRPLRSSMLVGVSIERSPAVALTAPTPLSARDDECSGPCRRDCSRMCRGDCHQAGGPALLRRSGDGRTRPRCGRSTRRTTSPRVSENSVRWFGIRRKRLSLSPLRRWSRCTGDLRVHRGGSPRPAALRRSRTTSPAREERRTSMRLHDERLRRGLWQLLRS